MYKVYFSGLPIYKPLQEPTLSTSQKSSIEDIAPMEHQVNFDADNDFSALLLVKLISLSFEMHLGRLKTDVVNTKVHTSIAYYINFLSKADYQCFILIYLGTDGYTN